MNRVRIKNLLSFSVFLTGMSTWALAELMGPLGQVMHSMSLDLKCLEGSPGVVRLLCANATAVSLASDLMAQAEKLHAHPEWVSAIVPSADPASVQAAAQELIDDIAELQSAIRSGDSVSRARAIESIKATEKVAHGRLKTP
jgi:hypothetical protein